MESNKAKLQKSLKKDNIYLVVAIIFLAILVICIVKSDKKSKEPAPDPISLINSTRVNEYATLDVQYLTEPFASKDDIECSFAMDKDNNMYIIVLNEDDLKRLQQIKDYTYSDDEDKQMPESVQIFGRTQEIPLDLKKLAIESYNEIYNEQIINEDNFNEHLSNVYLNTKLSPRDDTIYVIIEFICFIMILVLLIKYYKRKSKTRRTLKEYTSNGTLEYIYDQLDEMGARECIIGKLFLTREYIIDIFEGLSIIKYEDIKWIYPMKLTQYGSTVGTYIEVVKHNKQIIKICEFGGSNNVKRNDIFTAVYMEICNNVPNALKGYTSENMKLSKNL
jgi:hypothetical protein